MAFSIGQQWSIFKISSSRHRASITEHNLNTLESSTSDLKNMCNGCTARLRGATARYFSYQVGTCPPKGREALVCKPLQGAVREATNGAASTRGARRSTCNGGPATPPHSLNRSKGTIFQCGTQRRSSLAPLGSGSKGRPASRCSPCARPCGPPRSPHQWPVKQRR